MKYAIFLGCNIPARVVQYEQSARAVLGLLGVDLLDIKEFACCGYPVRNLDRTAFLLSAAHNMALAEQAGLDLLVLCKCGFGTFKEAQHQLLQEPEIKEKINGKLAAEGLHYSGDIKVKHMLSVLYHDVGLDSIKGNVTRVFKDLPIAVHYGCHALRPSAITQFDDPVAPVIFDRLVEATGAQSVGWSARLDCCGAPLTGINDSLSRNLTGRKLTSAQESGARFLCTSCPFCHIQFDTVQEHMEAKKNGGKTVPSILYSQLLGLSMGLGGDALGLAENRLDISEITSYLS
jgi:heterodisulfide reductase subunit B2